MKLNGAIFDFDGTLFDSMYVWRTAGSKYLESIGLDPEKAKNGNLRDMSLTQSGEYLKEKFGLNYTVQEIMDGIDKTVEKFYFNEVMPKVGVPEFLEYLKSNDIRMYIATATTAYMVEAALKRCNLLKYFEGILTCEEAGNSKQHPDIFRKAMDIISGNRDNTLIFEDAVYAIRTAKKDNFKVVAIKDRWEPKQEEIKSLADIYLNGYGEIKKLNELGFENIVF